MTEIATATLLALFWPALPFNEGRRLVIGPTKVDLVTTHRYGVLSVPSTFFVDPGGTIRHMQFGEMDEEKLQRGLDRIK